MLIMAFELWFDPLIISIYSWLGKETHQKTLEGMVVDLDITSHVTITQGGSNVQPYLNVADIFVLHPWRRNFPIVYWSNGSGLACVATMWADLQRCLPEVLVVYWFLQTMLEQLTDAIIHWYPIQMR